MSFSISIYSKILKDQLQSASLVPNFPLPQRAPGEIKLVIPRSASLNLASVFNYNGRSFIIGIMRRKGAHNGAHNVVLRSPFCRRWAF